MESCLLIGTILVLLFFGLVFIVHVYYLLQVIHRGKLTDLLQNAKTQFYMQREWLEASFVTFALAYMDSNLWIWDEAEFGNDVLIARSKKGGKIFAYIPVTVEMSRAMRDLSVSDNALFFQKATIIVQYQETQQLWQLTGKAFFNQSPGDVVQKRMQELHLVETVKTRV